MRLAPLFSALALAVPAAAQPPPELELELEPVTGGLFQPVAITHAGDGSGRLFVAEQRGTLRIVRGGVLLPTPFLDLRTEVRFGGEQGLLGVAFHPEFALNGFVFVHHTDLGGNTRVARYRVSATDPDVVDPSSRLIVLEVAQFAANHNGGQLAFGPDGMLYVALGDGGGGGDPMENGQDLGNLLGKILRLDVGVEPFAVPPDNPFVGVPGARGEIWVYGLRNPWRFSFDRATGDLFIGDVGQNAWEEIDFQPAASAGGENYGWDRMEGPACFEPASGCEDPSLVLPILYYDRDQGYAVTGGYRYRGGAEPALRGVYLYADFGSGRIWGATPRADGSWGSRLLLDSGRAISTFGEDEAGELYVADYLAGSILRLKAGGAGGCPWPAGHPHFCRDCGPCADGEGDCDNDGQCEAGTSCAMNVGAQFGYNPNIDVCVAPSGGCPWPAGHPHFCRDCGPCGDGEGDCDNDGQCEAGTSCAMDVGAQFGYNPNIDVCVAPSGGCPWPLGHPRFCRDCGPCADGEGDCDNDGECAAGTVCAPDVGADFGFHPNVDVCLDPGGGCPWPLGHAHFCRDCGPCQEGEGDCDNDGQCAAGLSCEDDVGAAFGFGPQIDVCLP